jgi:hypothetical protein
MQVPTPTDGKRYPPFPIDNNDLWKWVEYLDGHKSVLPSPITPDEQILNELVNDFMVTAEGSSGLTPLQLRRIASASNTASESDLRKAQEEVYITDLTALPVTHLPQIDITRIPIANVYAPPMTPTDWAFVNGSIANKVDIALALATDHQDNWKALMNTCSNQLMIWDQKIEKLVEQRTLLLAAEEIENEFLDKLRERAHALGTLKQEVDDARQNPMRARLLDREMRRHTESSPPPRFSHAPPAQPRLPSPIPPSSRLSLATDNTAKTPRESPAPMGSSSKYDPYLP